MDSMVCKWSPLGWLHAIHYSCRRQTSRRGADHSGGNERRTGARTNLEGVRQPRQPRRHKLYAGGSLTVEYWGFSFHFNKMINIKFSFI